MGLVHLEEYNITLTEEENEQYLKLANTFEEFSKNRIEVEPAKRGRKKTIEEPEIDFDKLIFSRHAISRMKSRLQLDPEDGAILIKERLKSALYICKTAETEGFKNKAHLFGIKIDNTLVEIYVSLDLKAVKTIVIPNNGYHSHPLEKTMKHQVLKINKSELRKALLEEIKLDKEISEMGNVDTSVLDYKLYMIQSRIKYLAKVIMFIHFN